MRIVYYFSRIPEAATGSPAQPVEVKPDEDKIEEFYKTQTRVIRANSSDEIKLVVLSLLPPKSKIKRLCKFSAISNSDEKDTVRIFEVTSGGNTWYLFTRVHSAYNNEHRLTTVAFPQKGAAEKIRQIFERGKDIIQIGGYGNVYYNPTFDALWYEDSDCGDSRAIAPLLGLCKYTVAEAEASPCVPEDGDTWIELGPVGCKEPEDGEGDYEDYARKLEARYPNFDYEQVCFERFRTACGLE